MVEEEEEEEKRTRRIENGRRLEAGEMKKANPSAGRGRAEREVKQRERGSERGETENEGEAEIREEYSVGASPRMEEGN